MKSLLQEAPSVERAIAQAWEAAGSPHEFSVKIHDHGKRGFLGFSSKPAVVSITYKPIGVVGAPASPSVRSSGKSTGVRSESSEARRDDRRSSSSRHDCGDHTGRCDSSEAAVERSERVERSDRSDRSERPERADRNDRRRSSDRGERPERGDRRDVGRRGERSAAPGVRPRGLLSYVEGEEGEASDSYADASNRMMGIEPVERSSSSDYMSDDSGAGDLWEPSYVDSVVAWLKEIITTIGYPVTFESRVSGKVLHVDFSSDFVGDAELSRSLYASLSFVLLQFLKREHKRRFRGLRIALTHPGQESLRFESGS
jgi:predicted RNA-binding protein Jag